MRVQQQMHDESWGAERFRQPVLWSLLAASVVLLLLFVHTTPGIADNVAALVLIVISAGVLLALWPSLDPALIDRPMAPLIAFIGCDGSGKSTLTHTLADEIGRVRPVQTSYLGLGSGALGERIRQWPVIGAVAERRLARKATQARTEGGKIPGLLTAIVIYGFSLVRLRRFKRMLRARRQGVAVLTDRYPQVEVPGIYDGPGLSAAAAPNWIVAKLAERERRIYMWMTRFKPDVVIRLNIDAATALARKPDHRADLVMRKVAITPTLRFAGAPIVDLDARATYAEVRGEAARIVVEVLAS